MYGKSTGGKEPLQQAGYMSSQQHELRFASAAVQAKPEQKTPKGKEGKKDV